MTHANVLDRSLFFIRESTGVLKASYDYDIVDPENGEVILRCREHSIGVFTRLLRFTDLRQATPFDFKVETADGELLMRVSRGVPILSSRVRATDEQGIALGSFALKPFSISGAFNVLDATGIPVCSLKGGVTGRCFRFLAPDGVELARVRKKWAGVGKELFSAASDYVLEIAEAVPQAGTTRRLILASVLCVGMVLKVQT